MKGLNNRRKYYWTDSPDGKQELAEVAIINKIFGFGGTAISNFKAHISSCNREEDPIYLIDHETDKWMIEEILPLNSEDLANKLKLNYWNYLSTMYMSMGGY